VEWPGVEGPTKEGEEEATTSAIVIELRFLRKLIEFMLAAFNF
jgi:hypothetical protein